MIREETLLQFEKTLGKKNVETDKRILEKRCDNTLGIKREILAVLYPGSTSEVKKVVEIARDENLSLYPVSRGQNKGYGDMLPVEEKNLIVNLSRMNSIHDFDENCGTLYVQPGVSQIQLYNYLKDKSSSYWMDATGAGLDASIVGNALEGGFGHTPRGNRREAVSDLEIVTGTGEVFRTGNFPGLGPDLKGVFVQSAFGIVTDMKIELMPVPEHYESFLIKIGSKKDFKQLLEKIAILRKNGVLTSLVHIANAVRSLVSLKRCPEDFKNRKVTEDDAVKILSTPLVKAGYWTVIGGLYGSRKEIKLKKEVIRKTLDFAETAFFSDSKISMIEKLSENFLVKKIMGDIKESLKTLQYIHGLGKGVPSDEALKNIHWRTDNEENLGLIWHSATFPVNGDLAEKTVTLAKELFSEYGFELPVTMTLIDPKTVITIISICFDRKNEIESRKANELYKKLDERFKLEGILPYRRSVMGMDVEYENGREVILKSLKKTFDPGNIISPGRYGI